MAELIHVHPPMSSYGDYDGLRIKMGCGCEWRKGDMAWTMSNTCSMTREAHGAEMDAVMSEMSRPCAVCAADPTLFVGYDPRRQQVAAKASREVAKQRRASTSVGDTVKLVLSIAGMAILSFAVFSACGAGGVG